jgi:hypothetical protein
MERMKFVLHRRQESVTNRPIILVPCTVFEEDLIETQNTRHLM